MIKKENLSENNYYKEDIDSMSSNQKAYNKSIFSSNKESVNKKSISKKDSIKSTDNESDLSQKKLPENIRASFFKNNFLNNSAFNQIFNPAPYYPLNLNFYFPFNYSFNTFQTNPFIDLYQNKLYDIEKCFKELLYNSGNSLLNKKRKIKTIIFPPTKLKNENEENKEIKKEKTILFQIYKRKKYYYKESKNNLKKKEIKRNIYCCHSGCSNSFKTQKQAIFHHYKMAPECQEDTICFLKTIFETKKMLLKNIGENTNLFDKFSKLYESSMNEIILTDYINTITGKKLKDKLD